MGLLSVLGSDVQDPVATVVIDCQPVLRWTARLSCHLSASNFQNY